MFDQEDGLLGMALALDQPRLLAAVLGVVAGIGLVRDQPGQVGHLLLEVGVDGDGGAVVAEVVVEPRPRLVGDHLVGDGLGVGQRVFGAHAVAQRAGERVDGFLEPVGRDLLRRAVRLHSLGERSAAAQCVVELAVRLPIALRVALGDVHVEIRLHLVDEADVLARELPAGAGQRPQVGRDVVGAGRIEAVGVRHLGDQPLGRARASSAGSGAGSFCTC